MEERNKTLLILVIILSFITVGLSSYIVYDKFIKDDNVEEKKESTNDTSKKEENNNVIKVTDYKKTIGEILNEKKNLKDNVDIILDYGKLGNKEVKVNITGKKEELVYNSKEFVINGRNGNCAVNYDKHFSVDKKVTEGNIATAKIMQGFFGDATEAGVIILDNGDVYEASLGCDNNVEYKKVDFFDGYKVKDIVELNLSPGCTINIECKKTATVILQDGTKKEIEQDISR